MFMNRNQATAEGARNSHFVLSEPLTFVFFESGADFVPVNQLTPLGSSVALFDFGASSREPHLMLVLAWRRFIHVGIPQVAPYRLSQVLVKSASMHPICGPHPSRTQAFRGAA